MSDGTTTREWLYRERDARTKDPEIFTMSPSLSRGVSIRLAETMAKAYRESSDSMLDRALAGHPGLVSELFIIAVRELQAALNLEASRDAWVEASRGLPPSSRPKRAGGRK